MGDPPYPYITYRYIGELLVNDMSESETYSQESSSDED